MKKNRGLIFMAIVTLFGSAYAEECKVRVGEYSGTVKAEWMTKTREMKLLEPIAFKGPDCKVWPVPKGALVDGASIPQLFWSVFGGPFEGRYRDASVIHDYYCKIRTEPWERVHKMFYYAMLANGVDSSKAAMMYYAVNWFGPRWELITNRKIAAEMSSLTVTTLIGEKQLNSYVKSVLATYANQPYTTPGESEVKFVERGAYSTFPKKIDWLYSSSASGSELVPVNLKLAELKNKQLPDVRVVDLKFHDFPSEVRLLSYNQPKTVSLTELERINQWISETNPTLETLQSTPPEAVLKD